MEQVLITRDANDTVNGVKRTGRVYITGPHFGRDIFSSTESRDKASRFSRDEAESLLLEGKWRWCRPEIENAGDA